MDRSLPTDADPPLPRLDRALADDLRSALRRPAVLAFLGLELAAAGFIAARRGSPGLENVALLWLGLCIVAFLAWWAGRHRLAVARPDPVDRATAKLAAATTGALGIGLVTWGLAPAAGAVLLLAGAAAWLVFALRGRTTAGLLVAQLLRDPRPFVPLLLLVAVPRALASGPGYGIEALLALPSGIGQQLAFLVGLFAPLEVACRRTDVAAVLAALAFGLLHVPMNLTQAGGDILLATANAMVFQAAVGAIACLAFVRHRAAVPIGVAHALAIA